MNQLSKILATKSVKANPLLKCPAKYQYISQRDFSFFENYSKTCVNYDTYRRANFAIPQMTTALQTLHSNGYQPLNKIFTASQKKKYEFSEFLTDLHILDAGCGTGNYIKTMADLGIGRITGLEFNEGMLGKCKDKFLTKKAAAEVFKSEQSVHLFEGNIIEMPFKPSAFDTIIINYVLHHVEDDSTRSDNYSNTRTVLERCLNVLRDGGELMITTSTPTQLALGLWYYQFFPKGMEEVYKKWCEVEWWKEEILKAGFSEVNSTKICETSMEYDCYYDFEGPFKKEWRNADSSFALISDEELKKGLKDISDEVLKSDETRKSFFEECEKLRLEFGHGTLFVARK